MDQSNNDKKYSFDPPEYSYGPPQQGQQMTNSAAQPTPQFHPTTVTSPSNVTVVVNQPTVQQPNQFMATTLDGHRTWTTGLFDCFSDLPICCFTWFCYPCALCKLSSRIGECVCAPACVPGGEINIRTRIRTVGGIRGSMCDDCMVICCCGPCAACQEARELGTMGIL